MVLTAAILTTRIFAASTAGGSFPCVPTESPPDAGARMQCRSRVFALPSRQNARRGDPSQHLAAFLLGYHRTCLFPHARGVQEEILVPHRFDNIARLAISHVDANRHVD